MNELSLEFRFYDYEIDGKPQLKPHRQADFVVDGRGLGQALGFEDQRPWFGQTCFEYLPDRAGQMIEELKGLRPVKDALHGGRFPLYRCHCGDIQCGVVSCVIQRTNDVVRWQDIRFEDDDDDAPTENFFVIPLFEFATPAYDLVIDQFVVNADR